MKVKELVINNCSVVAFSDGRIYRLPYRTKGGSKRKGYWLETKLQNGYQAVTLNSQQALGHRIIAQAFLPDFRTDLCVDHKNGIRHDNRCDNLRMVSKAQHALAKRQATCYASSKYRCVYWNKNIKKWKVEAYVNKCKKFFGYYESEVIAAKVANLAMIDSGYFLEALNEIKDSKC